LPKDFFEQLCILGKIDKNKLDYLEIEENWGQIKGGKS
jgi:hypothetical protein